MPLRETRGIQSLREALHTMDADLRKTRCPICGKPTGGFVFAGQTPDQAGLCTSAEHVTRAAQKEKE